MWFKRCCLHVPACFLDSFGVSPHTLPLLRTVHLTALFIGCIQRWSSTFQRLQKPFFNELLQRDALLLCAGHGLLLCTKRFLYSSVECLPTPSSLTRHQTPPQSRGPPACPHSRLTGELALLPTTPWQAGLPNPRCRSSPIRGTAAQAPCSCSVQGACFRAEKSGRPCRSLRKGRPS